MYISDGPLLLVLGGLDPASDERLKSVEVIPVEGPQTKPVDCNSLPGLPQALDGAVAAKVNGAPIVCGGRG